MYRILLFLSILETMAFDSDEAKYIDLLPEAEKEEFLNRIARRILEEIQSKGSPEESHTEVTNEQLDAHEAYVQDILKEESDNLRNEKREISQKAKDELDNEDPNPVNDRNAKDSLEDKEKTHIDLTLRDGEQFVSDVRRLNEDQESNENPKTNNDDPYSVVPVKVVDKDKVKDESTTTSISSTSNSEHSDKSVSESSDKQFNDSKSKENKPNSNEYKPNSSVEDIPELDQSNKESQDEVNNPSTSERVEIEDISSTITDDSSTPSNTKKEEIVDISNTTNSETIHQDSNNFQISEEQSSVSSDKEHKSTIKITIDSEKGSEPVTNIVSAKPTSKIIEDINLSDDVTNKVPITASFENTNNEPLIVKTTKNERYVKNLNISPEEITSNEQSTIIPLTTVSTQPVSNSLQISEKHEVTTTIKGLTKNPNTKHYNEDRISGNKEGNEKPRKYYRKKLKILSEDYSLEEVESFENNDRKNDHKDNEVGRYFVYEIPDDRQPYIQKAVMKDYEQPYYVPIYNFAPNNAYYNAYNHLGPNVNEDFRENQDESNNNELDDEELFTRNGFQIDLKNEEVKKTNYEYPRVKIIPNEYVYRFNPNLEEPRANYDSYVDTDYFYYPKKSRRLGYNGENYRWNQYLAGQQSLRSNVKDLPDFTMDKNIERLVYGSRRRHDGKEMKRKRHKKKKLGVRELPSSSEEDHPYYSIHKGNMKDHVRAVRKLLYKQKKFGFMPPSPYAIKTEPRYKRMMGNGLGVTDNDALSGNLKGPPDSNTNNISWDYYWGRLKQINNSNDIDDNDDTTLQIAYNKNENEGILKEVPKKITDTRSGRDNSKTEYAEVSIDDLTTVLKDMIRRDNRYLVSYKWLQTAVETNSAITKLLDLTERTQNGNHIHKLDQDLLNYVVDSYISSKDILKKNSRLKAKLPISKLNANESNTIACLLARMRLNILPKTKKRKAGEKIKNPINLWNHFYFNRVLNVHNVPDNVLADFENFLLDLQDNLYELHSALRRIALITTYDHQNWYQDLKSIFLKSAPRRRLLQVLLHLGTSKLVNSIENSMKKINSGSSVKNKKEDDRKTQEFFVFVLTVLEVINGGDVNHLLRGCNL